MKPFDRHEASMSISTKTTLRFASGLAVGLAAGFWLARWTGPITLGDVASEQPVATSTGSASSSLESPDANRDWAKGQQPAPSRSSGHVVAEPTSGKSASIPELHDQIRYLKERVAEMEASAEFEKGKRIEFPEELDKIYSQDALLKNMNAAFKEAGVESEISTVDCDEYPCIACGRLPVQSGDDVDINKDIDSLRQTGKSDAMAVYKDSGRRGSMSTDRIELPDGTPEHRSVFCQAFYPKPDDEAFKAVLEKRTAHRMEQLRKGM